MKHVSTNAASREAAETKVRQHGVVTASLIARRPYGHGELNYIFAVVHAGDLENLPAEKLADYFPDVTSPDGSRLTVDGGSDLWIC